MSDSGKRALQPFNSRPWFADRQAELLRQRRRAGEYQIYRRADGVYVRRAPDDTETVFKLPDLGPFRKT